MHTSSSERSYILFGIGNPLDYHGPRKQRQVPPRVASVFGSIRPPSPTPIKDDTNSHLIGPILRDKYRLGRFLIEPDRSTWYPASKEVNKTVKENVRRIFAQPWHSWSQFQENYRQLIFEEFKAEAIDVVQFSSMSQQITNLSCTFAKSAAQNKFMINTIEKLKKQVVSMSHHHHRSPSPDSSGKEETKSEEFVDTTP
ncbi:hypothetical protein FXO38_29973 [Capsicum annuum]|nr:hypothetical protein FXO38_29973 [Capsicum annuum]